MKKTKQKKKKKKEMKYETLKKKCIRNERIIPKRVSVSLTHHSSPSQPMKTTDIDSTMLRQIFSFFFPPIASNAA